MVDLIEMFKYLKSTKNQKQFFLNIFKFNSRVKILEYSKYARLGFVYTNPSRFRKLLISTYLSRFSVLFYFHFALLLYFKVALRYLYNYEQCHRNTSKNQKKKIYSTFQDILLLLSIILKSKSHPHSQRINMNVNSRYITVANDFKSSNK